MVLQLVTHAMYNTWSLL